MIKMTHFIKLNIVGMIAICGILSANEYRPFSEKMRGKIYNRPPERAELPPGIIVERETPNIFEGDYFIEEPPLTRQDQEPSFIEDHQIAHDSIPFIEDHQGVINDAFPFAEENRNLTSERIPLVEVHPRFDIQPPSSFNQPIIETINQTNIDNQVAKSDEKYQNSEEESQPLPYQDTPNVILILNENIGFGAATAFGGAVKTNTIDYLAKNGLRYNQFHTTGNSLQTRLSLLTGRNLPKDCTQLPQSYSTISNILKHNGYRTASFGKLLPSAANWGFDYSYGFINQPNEPWHPYLYENNRLIIAGAFDPNYNLDRDLSNHAIAWIKDQKLKDPNQPIFIYYATSTAQVPHQAPEEWTNKYQGRFNQGWDHLRETIYNRQKQMGIIPANAELQTRPKDISSWDSLTCEQQKEYAKLMEEYAGALSYTDYQIGRIIDTIGELDQLDNTIIVYVQGDIPANEQANCEENEVDEEKTDQTAWVFARMTPFKWNHVSPSNFAETRAGLVISYPKQIAAINDIRSQFHHIIDIAPTIYQLTKINPQVDEIPQASLDGISMAYTIDDSLSPSKRTVQFFENIGQGALYKDGWIALTTPKRLPWIKISAETNPLDYNWELYDLNKDFSLSNNLIKDNSEKLRQLADAFHLEHVTDSRIDQPLKEKSAYTFYDGMVRIPEDSPDLKNRSYTIHADINVEDEPANGVLLTQGGHFGGWALMIIDGKPVYIQANSNQDKALAKVVSDTKLTPGRHHIRFEKDNSGNNEIGRLYIDDAQVGEGYFLQPGSKKFYREQPEVESDVEELVENMPYHFNGTINKITLHLNEG